MRLSGILAIILRERWRICMFLASVERGEGTQRRTGERKKGGGGKEKGLLLLLRSLLFQGQNGPFPFGTHGGDLHTRKEEGKKAHETLPSFSQTSSHHHILLPSLDRRRERERERERERRTFFCSHPFSPFSLSFLGGRSDLSISLSVFFGPVSL